MSDEKRSFELNTYLEIARAALNKNPDLIGDELDLGDEALSELKDTMNEYMDNQN